MHVRVRNARLRGAKEAHRILAMMEARKQISKTDGQIDVFEVLASLDITVLFKPLDGLLGAYLRGDTPGVLINTKRPFSVQRFTGAHELGHAVMNHEPSLDSPDVLRRASADFLSNGAPIGQLQEIEADAFAGELLVPQWLVVHHAKIQGWNKTDLTRPDTIYQLALRCGCSYEATARSLERNQLITKHESTSALNVPPKNIKVGVRGSAEWTNPWADAWSLSEHDAVSGVPAAAGDLIRLSLLQQAGAGFLWQLKHPLPPQLSLLSEDVEVDSELVGADSQKIFVLRAEAGGSVELQLHEGRPWEDQDRPFVIKLSLKYPENGLSNANRKRLLAA